MSSKPSNTNLDDIAEAINVLAGQIDDRFEQVDKRFEQVDKRFEQVDRRFNGLEDRMTAQENAQRETNQRLAAMEGRLETLENDIKELYGMVSSDTNSMSELDNKTPQEKVLILHEYVIKLARQLGVKLPG